MCFPFALGTTTLDIDPGMSVNGAIARWPAAIRVLNAFGVDTCCGGGASLREAAADADVPVQDLLVALASADDAREGRP